MAERKQYMVSMEWAKWEGSIWTETCTDYYYANSKEDAEQQARDEYGHHSDFEIKSCYGTAQIF